MKNACDRVNGEHNLKIYFSFSFSFCSLSKDTLKLDVLLKQPQAH